MQEKFKFCFECEGKPEFQPGRGITSILLVIEKAKTNNLEPRSFAYDIRPLK